MFQRLTAIIAQITIHWSHVLIKLLNSFIKLSFNPINHFGNLEILDSKIKSTKNLKKNVKLMYVLKAHINHPFFKVFYKELKKVVNKIGNFFIFL